MFKRIRTRLHGNTEQGFTLIELLVVIIIIGILLATTARTPVWTRLPWSRSTPAYPTPSR